MAEIISLLGSTGSIGRQTLDICREQGIKVAALTSHSSIDLLERQAREFRPRLAVVYEMEPALELNRRLAGDGIEVAYGLDGLRRAASLAEIDTVVTAVVGMVGLWPTMAAIESGKRVALANKETLVCAGELVMDAARRYGAEIIPVDSEHSAIFQCLQGSRDRGEIRRLILTCSGGPFYGRKREELRGMTRENALQHPNWSMGAKITVDSATLMNKGLEVMEAMHLYGMPAEKISVVIHRESIIHSLVEYCDNAMIAQLGAPDMRLPIQYALTYPKRVAGPAAPLDLWNCGPLTFGTPDLDAFPCLALALEAARTGGTAGAVLNGANEEAVGQFLAGKIGFLDIPAKVEKALSQVKAVGNPTMQDILDADEAARAAVV